MLDTNVTYVTGYKKPPKSSQWKPGQSGNPKGRPKNAKSLKSIFLKVAQEQITFSIGGETVTLTNLEAVIKATFHNLQKKALLPIVEGWIVQHTLKSSEEESCANLGKIVKHGNAYCIQTYVRQRDIDAVEALVRMMVPLNKPALEPGNNEQTTNETDSAIVGDVTGKKPNHSAEKTAFT